MSKTEAATDRPASKDISDGMAVLFVLLAVIAIGSLLVAVVHTVWSGLVSETSWALWGIAMTAALIGKALARRMR